MNPRIYPYVGMRGYFLALLRQQLVPSRTATQYIVTASLDPRIQA